MNQNSQTILIVDDEDGARALLSEFLGMHGYAVRLAADARTALSVIEDHPIDLVVTDIDMPGMKGTELLDRVKADHPDLPVILITGKPSIDTAVRSLREGAFDYVTKPFDLNHLRQVIGNALHGDSLDQTLVMQNDDKVINGFALRSVISEGAMGIVHLAERDGRRYALKLISTEMENEDRTREMLERFVREAEMASAVHHPNIVEIVDFGIWEEELVPYIVMEYVNGLPLSAMSNRLDGNAYGTRADIIRQIADALAVIHDHHILHRDIKPSNVLVTGDLVAKLTDFGVARPKESELTHHDQILGSPLYLAPEAYIGDNIDARADLFSLGVVAYEFLLGALPFEGDSIAEIAGKIVRAKPLHPRKLRRDFPTRLVSILSKLLKKEPADRYQSARELADDLKEFSAAPEAWPDVIHALTKTNLFSSDWE